MEFAWNVSQRLKTRDESCQCENKHFFPFCWFFFLVYFITIIFSVTVNIRHHVIKYTLTIYIPGDYSLEATRTSLIFYLFKKGKRLLWIRNMLKSSDLKEQKHITPFLKRKEGFEPVLHSRLQVSWYSVTLFDSDLFSSTVLSFKPSKGSCVKYSSHWLYHCSEFLWSAYWERNKSY